MKFQAEVELFALFLTFLFPLQCSGKGSCGHSWLIFRLLLRSKLLQVFLLVRGCTGAFCHYLEFLELILAAPTIQILFIPIKMPLTWEI